MNKNYRFKGHDWSELSEALGIKAPFESTTIDLEHGLFEDEVFILEKTQEILNTAPFSKEEGDVIYLCRQFLKSFIAIEKERQLHTHHMARAMLELENDAMLSWLTRNLRFMWC